LPSFGQGKASLDVSNEQKMIYEVYAGGINAVSAELDLVYKPGDKYSIELSAHTKGFLGTLAPWSGSFETKGWAGKSFNVQGPELHKSIAVWREEEEIKEYFYEKDGKFKMLKIKDHDKEPQVIDVDDSLTQGTIDALTATLNVLNKVAEKGQCAGSSEVFDGKRRFEMIFTHLADETLDSTRYNAFSGKASKCQVEVKPVSGAWHKKPRGWLSIQEQGRQRGSLPTVWIAKVDEDGPAIPVKLRVKTEYGTLFMHLIEYRKGNAVKLAKDS
jgi:hypothetical protein